MGLLYMILLYIACFVFVNIVKFALIGLRSLKERPPEQPQEAEKKDESEKKPEPEQIYYIVERKKARSKATYSKPREIRFSDGK